MKKYYIALSYKAACDASVKPTVDFEAVLRRNGFRNIGLPPVKSRYFVITKYWNILSYIISGLRIKKTDTVVIQYPGILGLSNLLFNQIVKRNPDTIILIHDLEKLRHGFDYCHDLLENAGVIIAHTDNMHQWIEKNIPAADDRKIIDLGIFDYALDRPLVPQTSQSPRGTFNIVFAGNLAKAHYLEKINFGDSPVKIKAYGTNPTEKMKQNPSLDYCGLCTPEELLDRIAVYDFGLVWDGDSIDGCSGDFGNYLRYNSPYKMSSYLCAGLPVILWSQMGMRQFAEENNIGICVDSLAEIPQRLAALTPEEYAAMRKAAAETGQRLRTSYYSQRALDNALKVIDKKVARDI